MGWSDSMSKNGFGKDRLQDPSSVHKSYEHVLLSNGNAVPTMVDPKS